MTKYTHRETASSDLAHAQVFIDEENDNKELCVLKFESVTDAIEASRAVSTKDATEQYDRRPCKWFKITEGKKLKSDEYEWFGFGQEKGSAYLDAPSSKKDFEDLFFKEWQEGISTVDEFYKQMIDAQLEAPRDRRRTRRWSVDNGDDVCLDRLRAGQDYWQTTRRNLVGGPASVSFFVQVGVTNNHHWRDTLWRVASAIAAAEILEQRGYSVSITAVSFSHNTFKSKDSEYKSVDKLVSMKLKEHGQSIDRSALVNAMACWSFRTLWFRLFAYANTLGLTKQLQSGLGRTASITAHQCQLITEDDASFVFQHTTSKEHAMTAAQSAIDIVGKDEWFDWDDDCPW